MNAANGCFCEFRGSLSLISFLIYNFLWSITPYFVCSSSMQKTKEKYKAPSIEGFRGKIVISNIVFKPFYSLNLSEYSMHPNVKWKDQTILEKF